MAFLLLVQRLLVYQKKCMEPEAMNPYYQVAARNLLSPAHVQQLIRLARSVVPTVEKDCPVAALLVARTGQSLVVVDAAADIVVGRIEAAVVQIAAVVDHTDAAADHTDAVAVDRIVDGADRTVGDADADHFVAGVRTVLLHVETELRHVVLCCVDRFAAHERSQRLLAGYEVQ